jgi:hypothetical protein
MVEDQVGVDPRTNSVASRASFVSGTVTPAAVCPTVNIAASSSRWKARRAARPAA